MGIGRQVADAYIDVHGDLSKFRKDLNKANGSMADWAENQADAFAEAWGKRTEQQLNQQWGSVIDAMHSGKRLDFNQMIDNFDSSDLEASFVRIDDMLGELQKKGKVSEEQSRAISRAIADQVEILEKQRKVEGRLAADREMWDAAHRRMMLVAANEQKKHAESEKKMFAEAFAQNARYDAARKKLLAASVAANARAASARRKQFEDAIRDNEAWAKSFTGVMHAAQRIDLEQKFKNIGHAMATNDWSRIAQGAENMSQLRNRTMQTAQRMRDLGRITDDEFAAVQVRLVAVGRDLDSYNVRFRTANDSSSKHARDWSLIQRLIGNAGKKFAGFSGLNVLSDVFRDGAAFFQDLDRNAVKIGKMAAMVGTLGSAVVTMLGGVAVIGQDLAKLGQIGILGPAFLFGAAIQAGVLVAALKDMKEVLGDLGPRFEELQDTISGKFWDVAEQPIRNLVDTLLPTLSTKLGETAAAWGGMFAQMADSLGSISTDRISTMFDRMNAGINIAVGAVDPLIQAFATLGDVGSQYFERFGTWIVDLSTKFNDFIQGAAADGRLNAWIEEAIQAFKDVWSILGSVVGIFNAVGDAAEAAGIGGLFVLANNMEKVSSIMNSEGFQTTLTQLFSGAAGAAESVGTAILGLGPAIASIMPTLAGVKGETIGVLGIIGETVATVIGYIGQILSNPAVQKGLTDFVTGIQSGVEALGPAIGPIGDSLGQVGTLLGQVAGTVGTLVAALATSLSPVLDVITAAFGRITFAAGPEIVSIIETLGAGLGTVVDILLPPLENLILTLLPLFSGAIEALAPLWGPVAEAIRPFIDGISQLVEMLAPVLIPAIEKIATALGPVLEAFGVVADVVLSVLVPIIGVLLIGVINNIVGVFEGFSNIVQGVVKIITSVFTGFGDFFTKLFEGDIGGALGALGTMFKGIWDGIWQVVKGALELLWNGVQLLFIGKLIGGIKTGLSSILGFFKSSWDNIGSTVSGALSGIINTVNSGIATAARWVANGLSNMVNFFTSGFSNMASAASNGIGNVMGWIGGIPGRISGALSGLGNLLWSAGSGIINGLLNGLKASWGAVTSFVGGIASWIRDNKGPLPYDRALLIPAGNAIMEGLGKGLEDKLGMLKSTLNTVTDTMTDSVTAAFAKNKMYLAGADAALGLADGLKSNKGALTNALSAVMPDASTSVSANLVRPRAGAGSGVGTPTPSTPGTVLEAGAIVIQTPTKNPEIVASKVIDEFANYSNL